jgi:hypothetical protein
MLADLRFCRYSATGHCARSFARRRPALPLPRPPVRFGRLPFFPKRPLAKRMGGCPRPFWSRTRTAQISLMKPYYNSVHEKQLINAHNDR